MSEAEWQQVVIGIAESRGWRTYHTYDSRRSNPGWPDVVAVRYGRMVAAELKSMAGKVTADQREWLAALDGVLGIETYVWKPADLLTVEQTFT